MYFPSNGGDASGVDPTNVVGAQCGNGACVAWKADGTAVVPGNDPAETTVSYTLNGKASVDVSARSNERLRLRFINGSRRTIIALKLEHVAVTVMAIDSQPTEPFLALRASCRTA